MARHGVTDAAIRSHVRREGWSRPKPDWLAIKAASEAGERVAVRFGVSNAVVAIKARLDGWTRTTLVRPLARRTRPRTVQRSQNANGGYRDFNRVNASSTFTFTHSAIAPFISSGSAGNA